MMQSYSLRTAGPADIPELVRLRLAYFTEEFGTLPEEQVKRISAQLPEYFKHHLSRDCCVYVAEDDGRIRACAILCIQEKPANPYFPTGRIGEVLGVYTEPEYRGNRIATWLMKLLLVDSMRKKLDTVRLGATEQGMHVYQRLGFKPAESPYTAMEYVLWNKSR